MPTLAYAKIEPSGCEVWHGGLDKFRFDLFLTEDAARYNDPCFFVIDQTSREFLRGYRGRVDEEGKALDRERYQRWEDRLPRIWLPERGFHSHILRFEPDVSQDEIESAINHHIPNFYKAWTEELDKIPGGMRKGWDIATRPKAIGRPRRYDREMNPQELQVRRSACQDKLNLVVASNLSVLSIGEGELFPSTEIDVGMTAENRGEDRRSSYTHVCGENAANDTGAIDSVEIFARSGYDLVNCEVASFFVVSGNNLSTNDSEALGGVTGGSKQTFTSLDMDIETGEFIGTYFSDGRLEADEEGGANWTDSGDLIPCTNNSFDTGSYILSLYGTGETVAADATVVVPLATVDAEGLLPTLSIGSSLVVPLATIDTEALLPTLGIGIAIVTPLATVDAEGLTPTLSIGSLIAIPLATIDAEALTPTVGIGTAVVVPLATIDSEALAPTLSIGSSIVIPLATIDAEGLLPTLSVGSSFAIPLATIDAEALAPTLAFHKYIAIPLATIDAQGLIPTLFTENYIAIPLATADVEGLTPTLSIGSSLAVPLATIDAEALIPTLSIGISLAIPLATIDAEGLVPSVALGILIAVPLATIDAEAKTPTLSIGSSIAIPVATADVSALIPRVIVEWILITFFPRLFDDILRTRSLTITFPPRDYDDTLRERSSTITFPPRKYDDTLRER